MKLQQSKTELGIDINTADMIHNILGEPYVKHDTPIDKYHTPAWSLSSLIGLMPFQIIEDNERYGFTQYKGYNSQGETYRFEYVSNIGIRLYETYYLNNPIDAAFEMVCWLLENKKL